LKQARSSQQEIEILDLGCGYGRDSTYLALNINCHILGIDNSGEAIDMARKALSTNLEARVRFQCCDFSRMPDGKFDVIFASNVYHLLRMDEREAFKDTVKRRLKPGGLLFLSMLSPNDPEHYGKGKPVDNEANSYMDQRYLHFCTRDELEQDFGFLTIEKLSENEYYEPRSNGEVHHHIIWLFLGMNRSGFVNV